MNEGWIKIYRKIIDSEIWHKPPHYLKVWMYLLLRAQYTTYNGLKRGQIRTSIKEIQENTSWKSGFRTEKISTDQIKKVFQWMRTLNNGDEMGVPMGAPTDAPMISTKKVTHGIVVTIENYCIYQDKEEKEKEEKKDTDAPTEVLREHRTGSNINKECKELKKKDILPLSKTERGKRYSYPEEFNTFWKAYPKPVEKRNTFLAWQKAVNNKKKELRVTPSELVRSAQNYRKFCEKEDREKKYIKSSTTFLGSKAYYLDYIESEEQQQEHLESKKRDMFDNVWKIYARKEDAYNKEKFEEWYKNGADEDELRRSHFRS